jgi:hypothetical protein
MKPDRVGPCSHVWRPLIRRAIVSVRAPSDRSRSPAAFHETVGRRAGNVRQTVVLPRFRVCVPAAAWTFRCGRYLSAHCRGGIWHSPSRGSPRRPDWLDGNTDIGQKDLIDLVAAIDRHDRAARSTPGELHVDHQERNAFLFLCLPGAVRTRARTSSRHSARAVVQVF